MCFILPVDLRPQGGQAEIGFRLPAIIAGLQARRWTPEETSRLLGMVPGEAEAAE